MSHSALEQTPSATRGIRGGAAGLTSWSAPAVPAESASPRWRTASRQGSRTSAGSIHTGEVTVQAPAWATIPDPTLCPMGDGIRGQGGLVWVPTWLLAGQLNSRASFAAPRGACDDSSSQGGQMWSHAPSWEPVTRHCGFPQCLCQGVPGSGRRTEKEGVPWRGRLGLKCGGWM